MTKQASTLDQFTLLAKTLGLKDLPAGNLVSYSPIDGVALASLQPAVPAEIEQICMHSRHAFMAWRSVPAPARGQLVKALGQVLVEYQESLAQLVTLEVGKSIAEARGEVQEMIDICEFAVGLSRQLHGLTIASERPQHHLLERYHPLGPVLVISAFNFPVAVWSWNTALALVCGDSVVWKPSESAPLCALACDYLLQLASTRCDIESPQYLHQVVSGDGEVGALLTASPAFALVSATGSTRMGKEVGKCVVERLGKVILELGGNNAAIVAQSADVDLAARACTFAAAGTAGQRCTTMRRVFVQRPVLDRFKTQLLKEWQGLSCGDPRLPHVMAGPLINQSAADTFRRTLKLAVEQGGRLLAGGEFLDCVAGGFYANPAVIEVNAPIDAMREEAFVPVVYLASYDYIEQAIELNNSVSHGLSSCIFTNNLGEAELFLSATGSDCGIANVNIGTSGAEIGGAFGGEKHSGIGRESGSDAWKQYMRRQTQTINYSSDLPLAQGISFDQN